MPDDPSTPDDVLSGLPRTRPQRSSAKRDAARAKAAKAASEPAAPRKNGTSARPKPKVVTTPPREPTTPARPAAEGRTDQSPAELAAAAVKATGELIELGGKVLKGVLGRLPRP